MIHSQNTSRQREEDQPAHHSTSLVTRFPVWRGFAAVAAGSSRAVDEASEQHDEHVQDGDGEGRRVAGIMTQKLQSC